jgi:hypothetical protein
VPGAVGVRVARGPARVGLAAGALVLALGGHVRALCVVPHNGRVLRVALLRRPLGKVPEVGLGLGGRQRSGVLHTRRLLRSGVLYKRWRRGLWVLSQWRRFNWLFNWLWQWSWHVRFFAAREAGSGASVEAAVALVRTVEVANARGPTGGVLALTFVFRLLCNWRTSVCVVISESRKKLWLRDGDAGGGQGQGSR